MNKEYIYIDGKAIIKDEKGNQKPVEYYDNLDDVLIQENLIETMENGIKHLEKESESFKKINKRRYFPIMVPMTIGIITIGIPAILYLLESGSSGLLTISIDTIYGQMSLTSVLRLLIGGPALLIATFVDFIFYKQNKENLKQEKGINNELEALKKLIVDEKEKLIDLQKDKTREEENKEFRVVKVNDSENLKILNDYLALYFDLGYNGEKYYKYYQQDTLDNKLKNNYNNTEIQIAKKYLEEKGPTLVKKYENYK